MLPLSIILTRVVLSSCIYPVGWGEDKEHGVKGGKNSSYNIVSFAIVRRGCGEGTKNRRC